MRNVSDKRREENQNTDIETHLMFPNFFFLSKIMPFIR
jgi:hypothetical protein